jgi:hypothetical protein
MPRLENLGEPTERSCGKFVPFALGRIRYDPQFPNMVAFLGTPSFRTIDAQNRARDAASIRDAKSARFLGFRAFLIASL